MWELFAILFPSFFGDGVVPEVHNCMDAFNTMQRDFIKKPTKESDV